jgi:hypothetical protein
VEEMIEAARAVRDPKAGDGLWPLARWFLWFVETRGQEAHPSHEWNRIAEYLAPMSQCVGCGEFKSAWLAKFPCDPSKLAGKTAPCCECGEEYPYPELIAGEVFCEKCRKIKGGP